jgi:predicted membrane-bound spermidine synthase
MATLFLGAIVWFNRQIPVNEKFWYYMLLCGVVYNTIQLIVTLIPVLNGEVNSLGWSSVVIFAVFAVGNGYFLSQNIKANNIASQ